MSILAAIVCLLNPPNLDAGQPRNKTTFELTIGPFLQKHCARCHGAEKQSGERRFDTLPKSIGDSNTLADYQDILDQLNLGEMPPANEPQPDDSERRRVVDWLTKTISDFHGSHQNVGGNSTLRRLNAREYRNTIRDLFQIPTVMFDPSESFPKDQTVDHLDNVGDTLVTSGYLLQQYLNAADSIVGKAVYPLQKPPQQKWTFQKGFNQQPEIDQVHRKTNKFDHMTLYDVVGADKPEGAYGPIHAFSEGVPFDGIYEIRIRAEAVNRQHPYDDDFIGTDKSERLRLGIVPGDHTVGPLHLSQPVEPLLAEIELADEVKWYKARVWLDAGFTPRFTFRNGLMDARSLWGRLVKRYADQFPKPKRPGIVENRFNAIKFGKLPHIRIHEIEIEGPLFNEWPKNSQKTVFGSDAEQILESGQISKQQMRIQLQRFATRAYRRPASPDEIDRVMRVIDDQLESGRSSIDAYTDGIKTILCSPAFIYLESATPQELSDTALASRLSYFLWSSMPDEELLTAVTRSGNLKDSERLSHPETMQAQVERMLADKKSDAFIDGFLDSWLALRDLGSQPPDRDQFRNYYRFNLESAMREETHLFTRHLIDENLSIANFLDSNFTFADKRLARHYGIDGQSSSHSFRKVSLTDRRRGGLLGQAGILTVTANGIDTSPVVRGVWLLDKLLGTPPSPPPPDVEPLDPDIRGARTIREQLKRHRKTPSCNDCHRKIDPMGFALENFDPIGRWRTAYGKNQQIDASGEFPDGTSYTDIAGFKKLLGGQETQFRRALVAKLLEYALGRKTTPNDRPTIDNITMQLKTNGNGMRDLIRLVTVSNLFTEN